MKAKTVHFSAAALLIMSLLLGCVPGKTGKPETGLNQGDVKNSGSKGIYPASSPVGRYGSLQVIGARLCDEKGNPVQLMGMSTHDLTVSYAYITPMTVNYLVKEWKINVLRAAMYYDNEVYEKNPDELKSRVKEIVGMCESNGIYCIVDWHTLSDKNPLKNAGKAKEFFKEMSYLYGAKKHVIYEICNEPNGPDVHWENAVRPYAMEIIPVIRKSDSRGIILVGTGTWSQDIDEPVHHPLPDGNTMYVFHFYANSHKQELRNRVESAAGKIPLFCSEWGTTSSTGLSGYNPEESRKWLELMDKYQISWCNWAFWAAQDESAAINIWNMKAGTLQSGSIPDKILSVSGRFVRDWLTNRQK